MTGVRYLYGGWRIGDILYQLVIPREGDEVHWSIDAQVVTYLGTMEVYF